MMSIYPGLRHKITQKPPVIGLAYRFLLVYYADMEVLAEAEQSRQILIIFESST